MKQSNALIDFLNFEKEVRLAQEPSKLNFLIANKSYEIVPFTQAVVFKKNEKKFSIEAISATSNLNPDAPYIIWLTQELLPFLVKEYKFKTNLIKKEDLIASLPKSGLEYLINNLIYCQLEDKQGNLNGGVLYFSKSAYSKDSLSLVKELQLIYSQAYQLLENKKKQLISLMIKKNLKFKYILLLLLIPIMMLPIKQSVLAPAQVSSKEPTLIKTSIDGIISEILVRPNQKVVKNQVLFKLYDIELTRDVDKAQNNIKISKENYRQAFHFSYENNESHNYINILKTEIEKQENSLKYHQSLLKRTIIKAPSNGTIIFSSPKKWLGKPVKVGEKIMLLAIGNQKQLDVEVPVADMLEFSAGDRVLFYSNVSPLQAIKAEIKNISSEAIINSDNVLSFYIMADFKSGEKTPVIGSRGTAKLYRNSVSIFYFLFRRPIIYLQSIIGF